MKKIPPPIIVSARLIAYAYNDDDVEFTDRIELYVGEIGAMKRLGEMPCLALCHNYSDGAFFLLFCNSEWQSQGIIEFSLIEKAKSQAESGYRGISKKWMESPYSEEDIRIFLRDFYEVDPDTEWWNWPCFVKAPFKPI